MSKFYITAHQNSKKISIPLEQKHVYDHAAGNGEATIMVYPTSTTVEPFYGNTVTADNIRVLFNSNEAITIPQGTAENQRIGNKVQIKHIDLTTYIWLNGATMIAKFSHSEAITTSFNFRIMCVKFKEIQDRADLAQWYRDTFIYYRLVNVAGGAQVPFQSNWMDKMRESTPWTGSFTILYDKKFTMGKDHSTTQMNIRIPIKQNVNFDNTSNQPTLNQYINNIYCFLIGPSNNYLDCDCISQDKMKQETFIASALGYSNTNIKVKYYDL